MNRKFLFTWYETPKGQILQAAEAGFLTRAITVGCKQIVLQVGALGWENRFIDCTLYRHFIVADAEGRGAGEARKVSACAEQLPFQGDSVDMVILPHTLELTGDQHQVLREVQRVLKPEGRLIILNFNPWSWHMRYYYYLHREKPQPPLGHFIARAKIIDWLKLLNFEVEVAAGFTFKTAPSTSPCCEKNKHSPWIAGYAIKAIKRRYNIIPLTPLSIKAARLAIAGPIETPDRLRKS